MNRRDFVKLGGIIAASHGYVFSKSTPAADSTKLSDLRRSVNFIYDGSYLSPLEYSNLLMKLADEGKIKPDYYSNGGVVEELEHKFAEWLGKERAVFMPTGTLANHIAVRKLAGCRSRVIVQSESHIYNDSGDCVQSLSNLNLVPLGKDEVCFSLEDVIESVQKTKSGRVETKVSVISIESPVRRKFDRIVSYEKIKKLSDYARSNGIKIHIDGARLFVQAAHEGIPPTEYSAFSDTVYTSLYKCFNAASGAVLAGPKKLLDGLYNERRMFGGGLPFVWPFAAVALQFVDNFISDYNSAYAKAGKLFSLLEKRDKFKIERFPDGTHVFKLLVEGCDLNKFKEGLNKRNVQIGRPRDNGFLIKINPSLNRETADNLAQYFKDAFDEAG